MGRVQSGAAGPHTSKIPALHTLLEFTAVIETNRLIKSMFLPSHNANEEVALCTLSSSHLQSMTGISALKLTTEHPLGLYYFHLQRIHFAFL